MRKILLVEDEPMLRDAYHMIISTSPYEVDVAANGQEALEKCRKKRYDLVLLDLMMPVMDGIGFLEKFALPGGSLPSKVIVLSNLSSGQELNQAKSLGVHKNILKTDLSPSQLLETIRYEVEAS